MVEDVCVSHGNETPVIYPAHRANIHERRLAARVARCLPLTVFLATGFTSVYAAVKYKQLLLIFCAVLNTALWLYLVSSALFAIWGAFKFGWQIEDADGEAKEEAAEEDAATESTSAGSASPTGGAAPDLERRGEAAGAPSSAEPEASAAAITHLIVFPNYKEDEWMLAETLDSLQEAEGSKDFCVVLAMEEREGDAKAKGENLVERFSKKFGWIITVLHPTGLEEQHLDGSKDSEVPGKASNLKWAVQKGYEEFQQKMATDLDRIVCTVADADCLFHPGYFAAVAKDYGSPEFEELRSKPGSPHIYTMWQAPQLPFRNYYISPVPSRTWGYLASVDEIGGVTSLAYGGHHMVFSGYSLPLRLAVEAEPWDGDVVAEDHHAFVRCFFYAIHATALDCAKGIVGRCVPQMQVRPVFLPVKSTSVASAEGYISSWKERYQQARRHMQGVTELCYALLATWDTISTLPWRMFSVSLFVQIFRVNCKLICMHLLPTLQTTCLGLLSLIWLRNHKHFPQCPEQIAWYDSRGETLLCGLAGAWVLVWPVFVPTVLFIIANYLFIVTAFVLPKERRSERHLPLSVWHQQDGSIDGGFVGIRLTLLVTLCVDIAVFMVALAVPYAMVPGILAYYSTCVNGNRITYVTAAKLIDKAQKTYGTMSKISKTV